MHIEKLGIRGFGKLKDLELRLSSGLNVIYGSNETGKTTLQWFIKGMLYGMKGGHAARDGAPPPLKRFKPWVGDAYGGSMEYRLDKGSLYRIEKDFDRNTVDIYDSNFNNITGTFETRKDKQPMFAEMHLGLDELCFEKTLMVRQLETRLDGDGSEELLGRLANAGMTGFEDVSFKKAEAALREAIRKYVGNERTSVAPLDRVEARIKALTDRREAAAKRRSSLLNASNSLSSALASKEELQRKKAYLVQINELIACRNRLDELMAKEAGLNSAVRRLREVDASLAAASRELEELGRGAVARGDRVGVGKGAAVRGKGAAVQGDAGRRALGSSKALRALYWAAGFLAVIAAATGALAASGNSISIAVPISLLLLAAAMFLFALRGSANGAAGMEQDQGGGGVNEYETMLHSILGLKEKSQEITGEASLLFGRQIPGLQELEKALSSTTASIAALEGRLAEGLKAAAVSAAKGEGELYETGRLEAVICDSDPRWLQVSIEYELDKTDKAINDNLLDIKEFETLLKADEEDFEGLQGLEEELAELLEKRDKLKSTGVSLKLALDVLDESGREIRRNFAPALNDRMSRTIRSLTGGRYSDLRADDLLGLKTPAPEAAGIRPVTVLSGGTADQMYLALRLALAELLTPGDESLPLLLDEVFSQYDDTRTRLAFEYLHNEGSGRQIVLFTCKRREKEIAEEVCGSGVNIIEF